jgi:dihydrolipoamide dehydrogenase
MQDIEFDLIVIGAGPGGYVASIRAAQLGWKVACIEKEQALGGTCLRVGCIPSKALLESSELFAEATSPSFRRHGIGVESIKLDLGAMLRRKDQVVSQLTKGVAALFKKNGIKHVQGSAKIVSPTEVAVTYEGAEVSLKTKNILIATGSVPATLPGIEFVGDRIGSSTEALAYEEVPEHLIVIGAGYIGLELGSVWKRLGAKVTVLEYFDRILPGMDSEIAAEALKIFKKQKIEFRLGVKVTGARVEGEKVTVECEGAEPVIGDRLLVAVGRKPTTAGLELEKVGVELDERGRVKVDEHFKTSVDGIYAIGDVIPGPMLAHKAEEEGVACVERLITGNGHVNYDAIPGVAYTHPEIASVGKTEDALEEAGIEYNKGKFPFAANGRALGLAQTEGFVKLLSDKKTDKILGVHIIGPRAGDLIAEVAVAMEFGASAEDLARCVHAHPTLAEAVKESAWAAFQGKALNY